MGRRSNEFLKQHLVRLATLALLLWRVLQPVHAECVPPLQAPTADQLLAAQQQAKNRGFLWRISKDGHSSYVYGTLHVAKLEWIFPGEDVLRALSATDLVALELNLTDQNTVKEVQEGARKVDTAKVPPAFVAWVRAQAEENCMDLPSLQAMRPNFQLISITFAIARRNGLEAAYGIDRLLTQAAQQMSKPIEPLETAQQQLAVLSALTKQGDKRARPQAFSPKEQEHAAQVVLALADAWAQSDFVTLDNYAKWCYCMNRPEDRLQMKRAVADRNPHMAQRIDALHSQGHNVFAAVGSLHLIGGKNGVPGLLEQLGYAVQRVF